MEGAGNKEKMSVWKDTELQDLFFEKKGTKFDSIFPGTEKALAMLKESTQQGTSFPARHRRSVVSPSPL